MSLVMPRSEMAMLRESVQRDIRNFCRVRDCMDKMDRNKIADLVFDNKIHTAGLCQFHLRMIEHGGVEITDVQNGVVTLRKKES